MPYDVRVDPKLCSGTTNCVEEAPSAFEMGDDGIARLTFPRGTDEAILRGAEACPVEAIILIDLATGRRVFP